MQAATSRAIPIDPEKIPGMLATLCSYEAWLGPYHPQTLSLLTQVGIAYWQAGDARAALPVLEGAVRDLGGHLRPDHELRMQALAALRDLLMATRDWDRAAAVQSELLRCQILSLGSDHPQTAATRASLAAILLEKGSNGTAGEV